MSVSFVFHKKSKQMGLPLYFFLSTYLYVTIVSSLDVKPQKEVYTPNYNVYHNLSSIAINLEKIYHKGAGFIYRHQQKYVSRQNRNQHILRIRKGGQADGRVKILLSFGEHAREFLPIESLFYLLNKWTNSDSVQDIGIDLQKFDIYVIILANPDGRHFLEKTKNYCWRGTETGVDLNRNFDWQFGGRGSSADETDEEFRGTHAFSEPETRVYRDLTEEVQFDGFLSLHSGIRHIYIPFADTKSLETGREPENKDEMQKLARLLSTITKHRYQFGKASAISDYTADGTVFDYMAGVKKIPFSYAIELWGDESHKSASCFDLFNPPNNKLANVTADIYPMYIAFFKYILDWKSRRKGSITTVKEPHPPEPIHSLLLEKHIAQEVPSMKPSLILLCVLVSLTMLIVLHEKYPFCRRFYQRRRVINLRALGSTMSFNLFKNLKS